MKYDKVWLQEVLIMNNPFTLSFGKKPKLIINDIDLYEETKENF